MSDDPTTPNALERIPLDSLAQYEAFAEQLAGLATRGRVERDLLLTFFMEKLREQTQLVVHVAKALKGIDELRALRGTDNDRFDAKLDAVLHDNETTRRKVDGAIARVDILSETVSVLFGEVGRASAQAQKAADEIERILSEAITP